MCVTVAIITTLILDGLSSGVEVTGTINIPQSDSAVKTFVCGSDDVNCSRRLRPNSRSRLEPSGRSGWQQGRSSDNVCGEQEGEEEESDSEYRVGVG